MYTTTRAVTRCTTILITTFLLTALPAIAKAADTPVAPRPTATLARGDGYSTPNGSERVRQLQRRLRRAGERPGPIDGLFGPLTEAAVVRFQQHSGLATDGLAGPMTQAALRRGIKVVGPGAGYGAIQGSPVVRRVQRSLRLVGGHPGQVDGQFGPMTEGAVIEFQRRHGLAADGLVGSVTMAALARWVDRKRSAHAESSKAANNPAGQTRVFDIEPTMTSNPTDAGSHVASVSLPLVMLTL